MAPESMMSVTVTEPSMLEPRRRLRSPAGPQAAPTCPEPWRKERRGAVACAEEQAPCSGGKSPGMQQEMFLQLQAEQQHSFEVFAEHEKAELDAWKTQFEREVRATIKASQKDLESAFWASLEGAKQMSVGDAAAAQRVQHLDDATKSHAREVNLAQEKLDRLREQLMEQSCSIQEHVGQVQLLSERLVTLEQTFDDSLSWADQKLQAQISDMDPGSQLARCSLLEQTPRDSWVVDSFRSLQEQIEAECEKRLELAHALESDRAAHAREEVVKDQAGCANAQKMEGVVMEMVYMVEEFQSLLMEEQKTRETSDQELRVLFEAKVDELEDLYWAEHNTHQVFEQRMQTRGKPTRSSSRLSARISTMEAELHAIARPDTPLSQRRMKTLDASGGIGLALDEVQQNLHTELDDVRAALFRMTASQVEQMGQRLRQEFSGAFDNELDAKIEKKLVEDFTDKLVYVAQTLEERLMGRLEAKLRAAGLSNA